jgi:hypothetical protein
MGTGDSAVTYHSSLDKHAFAALVAVSSLLRSFIGELSESPDRSDPLALFYVSRPWQIFGGGRPRDESSITEETLLASHASFMNNIQNRMLVNDEYCSVRCEGRRDKPLLTGAQAK